MFPTPSGDILWLDWLVGAGEAGYQIDGAKVGWQLRSSGDYPVMCLLKIQHEGHSKNFVLFLVSHSLRRTRLLLSEDPKVDM